MENIKVDNNYGVIGKYNNELYLFYKKNDEIIYNKIIEIQELNKTQNYKIYNIICYKNLFFENIIINRRIYSSIMDINYLLDVSKNILNNFYSFLFL